MRKSIPIELDKMRNLRFGTNALINFQDITGKTVQEVNKRASLKDLRALLFCGLEWEDSTLTLEDIGNLLDIAIERDGLEGLADKIGKAVELAYPDKKK